MSEAPAPVRVLRVLNGRLAGTEKALPAEGQITIGHEYWQNIVIRTPETKGVALDLLLAADGAHLTVLSGEAQLLGSTIPAGQTAIVPPYLPFSIGGVAMAWGERESARWDEAGGLAAALPIVPQAPPGPRDQALAVANKAGAQLGGLLAGVRLPWIVGAVVLVALLLLAKPLISVLGLRGDPAERINRTLAAKGLATLHATDDASGGVIVSGVVDNEEQRVRAQTILRDSYIPGQVNVQTSLALAQSAAEVAHVQGLDANARPIGHAIVELHTIPLAPEQRDKLRRGIKADVPAVTQLVLREDLVSAEDAAIHTVQDVTRKVSSVVAGDPAYIQTADGTRYFPGAVMPTGHRLVSIEGHSILLEKNGRQTRLEF